MSGRRTRGSFDDQEGKRISRKWVKEEGNFNKESIETDNETEEITEDKLEKELSLIETSDQETQAVWDS